MDIMVGHLCPPSTFAVVLLLRFMLYKKPHFPSPISDSRHFSERQMKSWVTLLASPLRKGEALLGPARCPCYPPFVGVIGEGSPKIGRKKLVPC